MSKSHKQTLPGQDNTVQAIQYKKESFKEKADQLTTKEMFRNSQNSFYLDSTSTLSRLRPKYFLYQNDLSTIMASFIFISI